MSTQNLEGEFKDTLEPLPDGEDKPWYGEDEEDESE